MEKCFQASRPLISSFSSLHCIVLVLLRALAQPYNAVSNRDTLLARAALVGSRGSHVPSCPAGLPAASNASAQLRHGSLSPACMFKSPARMQASTSKPCVLAKHDLPQRHAVSRRSQVGRGHTNSSPVEKKKLQVYLQHAATARGPPPAKH